MQYIIKDDGSDDQQRIRWGYIIWDDTKNSLGAYHMGWYKEFAGGIVWDDKNNSLGVYQMRWYTTNHRWWMDFQLELSWQINLLMKISREMIEGSDRIIMKQMKLVTYWWKHHVLIVKWSHKVITWWANVQVHMS